MKPIKYAATVTVLALAFSRLGRGQKVAACGLLVFGLVWFAMRLRG